MTRNLTLFLAVLATPALAHDGLHHHPHGIEYGWVIACAIGIAGGVVLARARK